MRRTCWQKNPPDGIPGLNFFYEHVHLNFAGNYLLALNFAEKIKGLLPGSISDPRPRKLGVRRIVRAASGGDSLGPPAGLAAHF